jgi:CRISPR system Cascade subunit CasC
LVRGLTQLAFVSDSPEVGSSTPVGIIPRHVKGFPRATKLHGIRVTPERNASIPVDTSFGGGYAVGVSLFPVSHTVFQMARFITAHLIEKPAPGLPNRGADGSAKYGFNGGDMTQIITSQSVKAKARTSDYFHDLRKALNMACSVRSTVLASKRIVPALLASGMPEDEARIYAKAGIGYLFKGDKKAGEKTGGDEAEGIGSEVGEDEDKPAAKGKGRGKGDASSKKGIPTDDDLKSQTLVLGNEEIDAVIDFLRMAHKTGVPAKTLVSKDYAKKFGEFKEQQDKILNALWSKAGLDALLFGRMATSDVVKSIAHCVRVSAWMTTHPIRRSADFFVAQDTLRGDNEVGAGMMGTQDFTDGVYYGNVVIEMEALKRNLGNAGHLGIIVRHLLIIFEHLDPSAKVGSRGADAELIEMLVEVSDRAPRTILSTFADNPVDKPSEAAERMRTFIRERDKNVICPEHRAKAIICRSESPTTFLADVLAAAGL